jgi:release factor glutamine methyltransferase
MTAQEAFNSLKEKFKSAHIQSPELEASWLLEHFASINYLEQLKSPDQPIDDPVMASVWSAAERRVTGEPLAYILGYKEFFSNRFAVTPDVLIPRPETEILVEWAINWLHDKTTDREEVHVIDLGTGSGCIAVSIAKLISNAKVTAFDMSLDALTVAKQNAEINGVSKQIEFVHGDASRVFEVMGDKKFDLVLANPPYIDINDRKIDAHVKKYEPAIALFAADHGLAAIREWLGQATQILSERGAIAFEIGSDQGEATLKLARDLAGFSKHYILQDLSGHDRVLCVEK